MATTETSGSVPPSRLAVLIDADNAQACVTEELMQQVARYGTATIKRAYGDWTTTNLQGWKDLLHRLAIHPVQQFRYTAGKNATDSALIIDAMDILHSARVDGFCLVSSDSDFTRLATRIRESGLAVYGFGERKTPVPFVAACDTFVYTENLRAEVRDEPAQAPIPKLRPMLLKALAATIREDGWAMLAALGQQLIVEHPAFKYSDYDCSKLGELVRKQDYLEVKEVATGENGVADLYVRRRQNGSIPAGK